ncbi:hypothetical protein JB92DRAFT_3135981 [Gautieria morchelliformis]|nr:hypothetical protein JB92DRAFT_3135981 [Gautieria morchelliformis]
MEKNRGALEQRRLVGLETLQIASLDPGPSLDLIIRAAILGSHHADCGSLTSEGDPDLEWCFLTTVIRQAGWWIVVSGATTTGGATSTAPPCHVPLPGFDEFVKAESWTPEELPDTGDLFPSLGTPGLGHPPTLNRIQTLTWPLRLPLNTSTDSRQQATV